MASLTPHMTVVIGFGQAFTLHVTLVVILSQNQHHANRRWEPWRQMGQQIFGDRFFFCWECHPHQAVGKSVDTQICAQRASRMRDIVCKFWYGSHQVFIQELAR